jgi:hypothetical protein
MLYMFESVLILHSIFVRLRETDPVLAGRVERGQEWQNIMILVAVLVRLSLLDWLVA